MTDNYSEMMAMIFEIQRFCLHDGYGIRTSVFFKGCSLKCEWCCNPESQSYRTQIGCYKKLCIGCQTCESVCPLNAIRLTSDGVIIDRNCCEQCEKKNCIESCPPKALVQYGYTVTLDELMKEIEKDSVFYKQSSGGVTASGGEPLMQASFVAELFARCRVRGYHTAIETCSEVDFNQFKKVIPHTKLFLCDLKHVDAHIFKKYTGGNVSIILENLSRLSEYDVEVILRTPLIPGFNADKDSIAAICDFARSMGYKEIHFLPYHRLGMQKYISLSKNYPFEDVKVMKRSDVEELLSMTTKFDIQAKIGGDI